MSMTINPGAVVDESGFSVTRSIRIAAPVENVWAAVTEPEHVSRWFGRLELDGREATASGSLSWPDGTRIPIRIEAIDPLRSVSYRWGNDDALADAPAELDESSSTVFTFTLTAVDGGTELTVLETGFEATSDPVYNLESHRTGWNEELDKLVALVESEA